MKQLLKFKAVWCGPCKSLSSLMEGVDFGVPITEIDIDEDFATTVKYGVRSVPTLILVDGDTELKRTMGVLRPDELKAWIAE